jgi:hypothetical protein
VRGTKGTGRFFVLVTCTEVLRRDEILRRDDVWRKDEVWMKVVQVYGVLISSLL